MRRPNYRFERTERVRAKQAKKEEKLLRRQLARTAQPGEDDSGQDPASLTAGTDETAPGDAKS